MILRTCIVLICAAGAFAAERVQRFDADPAWDGVNNRIVPKEYPTIVQDFGYSKTTFAGKSAGEMGGEVTRASQPAFYADNIATKTLDDNLTASGSFAITRTSGGSGVFFGFFHGDQPGASGRPIGSLGMDFDCEGSGARLAVRLITAKNQSCGTFITPFIPGKFRPTPIRNDGTRYAWTLNYDPQAAGGRGQITFTIHGDAGRIDAKGELTDRDKEEAAKRFPSTTSFTIDLPEGYKQQGTTFDHFGLMNATKPGGRLAIYFDDLKYLDRAQEFSSDPNWDASGNRASYRATDVGGAQNFGFSDTNFAGGETRGEIGGTFWRAPAASYADRVGPLSDADVLEAHGKLAFTSGSPDSGMLIGWFNSQTFPGEKSLKNFIGVRIEGPTRVGHYFAPVFATAEVSGGAKMEKDAPVLHPDGKPHTWSIHYAPADGTIVVTLDQESAKLQIKPQQRGQATFDRFGVLTPGVGGSQVKIFFDDISYTSSR